MRLRRPSGATGSGQAGTRHRISHLINTLARLRALAAHGFRILSLRALSDPTYLAFSDWLFAVGVAVESLLPEGWGVHVVGDLAKL